MSTKTEDQRSPEPRIQLSRRSLLKAGGITLGSVSLMSLLQACGDGATEDSAGNLTLRMPFLQDMQVPDPDIMYEGEGVQVMLACYDGLVTYKPGTPEIVPQLAESWTVSDDQLTYTFLLKPGVKFHDGTPADAEAWVKSFKRRAAVNQGPAYMVKGMEKAEAKDATTLVVKLKEPNNAFLHYAACPWKMLATSPTAVAKHEAGGDLAQKWLKTHDAGTGPYVMKQFVPASHYVLERFDGYWGKQPYFKTIRIEVTPEIATQKLQLDQGAFDLVSHGFAIADVLRYKKSKEYSVTTTTGASMMSLYMNPDAGLFSDKSLRQAMMTAIDRATAVKTSFQGLTTVQKNFWPENMFPDGLAPFAPEVDLGPLTKKVASLSDKKVDFAWVSSNGAPAQQMAELIQAQLAPTGLKITIRAMPSAEWFDLCNQPAAKRPDMILGTMGGDALHLDTALRIFLRTGAKPLNAYQYSNPKVDALMDEAITKGTEDKTNDVYLRITKIIADDALFVPLCRIPQNFVTHSGISGVELDSYLPYIFNSAKIKRV